MMYPSTYEYEDKNLKITALIRANYRDVKNGIYEDMSFLETFLRNLLMGSITSLKTGTCI